MQQFPNLALQHSHLGNMVYLFVYLCIHFEFHFVGMNNTFTGDEANRLKKAHSEQHLLHYSLPVPQLPSLDTLPIYSISLENSLIPPVSLAIADLFK